MAKILTDEIIPELKGQVEAGAYQPGDRVYIGQIVLATGYNSKTRIQGIIQLPKSLHLISSIKFEGTNAYAIQWDIPWESIHIGAAVQQDLDNTINITDQGIRFYVDFPTSITNTTSNFAKGLCTLDGVLVME